MQVLAVLISDFQILSARAIKWALENTSSSFINHDEVGKRFMDYFSLFRHNFISSLRLSVLILKSLDQMFGIRPQVCDSGHFM